MKKLVIVGAGGFGRELLQWCKDINAIEKKWEIWGFLDDNMDALAGCPCDVKVIGAIEEWQPKEDEVFALAIADPDTKARVTQKLEKRGAVFVPVVHPTAHIGEFNRIGKGVVMYPNAGVTVNVGIGDFVTILDNTSIGHDAMLGDFTTVCASCGINGRVEVGSRTFVGCNVSTIPGVKIGGGCLVGAGSVVVSNIRDKMHVFGNPAKRMALPKTENE